MFQSSFCVYTLNTNQIDNHLKSHRVLVTSDYVGFGDEYMRQGSALLDNIWRAFTILEVGVEFAAETDTKPRACGNRTTDEQPAPAELHILSSQYTIMQ
jgi:hypothetical protein